MKLKTVSFATAQRNWEASWENGPPDNLTEETIYYLESLDDDTLVNMEEWSDDLWLSEMKSRGFLSK